MFLQHPCLKPEGGDRCTKDDGAVEISVKLGRLARALEYRFGNV
jgi:hypothetical protein